MHAVNRRHNLTLGTKRIEEFYQLTLAFPKQLQTLSAFRQGYTAIIEKSEFKRVQDMIRNRSPKECKPRTLNSHYLLSGLIYCGKCGYALQGGSAKSGQFHYYSCNNSIRKGKTACDTKMINKDRIEEIIIDSLKSKILTDENLKRLLKLTNQAIERLHNSEKKQISFLEKEISKHQRKLDNLYGILETGKLDIDDIAPRIKDLRASIDGFKNQKEVLFNSLHRPIPKMNPRQLSLYVESLKAVLSEGQIFEQKNFIKSFIKRITVNKNKIVVEYTYPVSNGKTDSYREEVLCSALKSSPNWTIFATIYSMKRPMKY